MPATKEVTSSIEPLSRLLGSGWKSHEKGRSAKWAWDAWITCTRKSQRQQQGSHTDNEVTSLSTLSSAECRLQATLAPVWGGFGNGRRERQDERYHIQIGIGIVTATVGWRVAAACQPGGCYAVRQDVQVNDPKQTLSLWDKWATMKIVENRRAKR